MCSQSRAPPLGNDKLNGQSESRNPIIPTLIYRSGDVELNPGPPKKDGSKDCYGLRSGSGTNEDSDTLDDSNILTLLRDIKESQKRLERKFDEQLSTINNRLTAVESRLGNNCINQVDVNLLKEQIVNLEFKVDELENRNRRDNLLFFGIDETGSETWSDTETKITDWIKGQLEVDVSDKIERAHRIGQKTNGKVRPIIVKFSSFKTKEEVWKHKTKLKNSNFRISEDFSAKIRKQRGILWKWSETDRNSDKRATLKYDKLILDGKVFKVDNQNEVYECRPPRHKEPIERVPASQGKK